MLTRCSTEFETSIRLIILKSKDIIDACYRPFKRKRNLPNLHRQLGNDSRRFDEQPISSSLFSHEVRFKVGKHVGSGMFKRNQPAEFSSRVAQQIRRRDACDGCPPRYSNL
ncbi:PREDICTED: uncharacterized protein LOC108575544 [Habropoda laboriosa]|uniref:uncharacterized protein LOC108575544 n=1 Tax=Habropoda laboriosa TaxID=597456 RepID=UPI00083E01A2|nr:PREDICTED: uncharacterized protein LOC108575544 [Habropoda laboriosa]